MVLKNLQILSKTFISCRFISKWSYMHKVGPQPLLSLTAGQLLEKAAEKYPDVPAIISTYQNKTIVYSELLKQADKLAVALRKLGLKRHDKVGIWMTSSIEWDVAMLACARTGLLVVQLNHSYKAPEMQYCVNKVGIKTLICNHKSKRQDYYEILNEIDDVFSKSDTKFIKSAQMPSLESVIMLSEESFRGTHNFSKLLSETKESELGQIREFQDKIQLDDPLNIQFTSGSTGNPKAVVLSHHSVVNNGYQVANRLHLDSKHHKICVQVPFFHTFGTTAGLIAALHYGTTLVVPDSIYNSQNSLKAIEEENCTIVYGTPTMYVDLVNTQKEQNKEIKLEIACSGGAPISPKLVDDLYKVLNVNAVVNFFGMTETTAIIFQSYLDSGVETAKNTVGYVAEHLEVKIVDENYNIVPRGTAGELCVRGYSTMLEYLGDEEKTKDTIGKDKWLRTGDKVILHEDGSGKIVGRLKDIIIRGGENIPPKEIEDYISTHPNVIECFVIGLPHERLGEEVCACIRLKPETTLDLDTLNNYCKSKLAHFKIPSKLVIFEEFPKTTSGKIQKFLLAEQILKNNK